MTAPIQHPISGEGVGRLLAENALFRGILEGIAARPTHEGGCYYNNRLSVFEAREALRSAATAARRQGEGK